MVYPVWLQNIAEHILTDELTSLHEEKDKYREALGDTGIELAHANDQLKSRDLAITAAAAEYQRVSNELADANEHSSQWKFEVDRLRSKLNNAEREATLYNTKRIEAEREAELLLEERADMALQIKNLKQELADTYQAKSICVETLNRVSAELNDANAQLDRTRMATPIATGPKVKRSSKPRV